VLGGEHVSDDFSADLEDRADDLLWNLILNSLLFSLMEDDTCFELSNVWPVFWVLVLSHFLIRIKFVFIFKSIISQDVLVKWLNDVSDSSSELVILIKHPCVLIWELSLVIWIWIMWSIIWLDHSLQEHLGVRLEEVREQLLLNLVDLLKGLDTVLKDGQDR